MCYFLKVIVTNNEKMKIIPIQNFVESKGNFPLIQTSVCYQNETGSMMAHH